MIYKSLISIAVLFLLFSCETDPLTLDEIRQGASVEDEEMVASGVTKTLKIKRASGTIEPVDVDGEICPESNGQLLVQGSGNASHLGRFTVQNSICLIDGNPVKVTGVMTAANGDQIFTYVIGTSEEEGVTYYQYVIYNGTGRFEGITGEILVYGTFGMTTWTLKGEGTFTYP